jgi:hypothetical protein
VGGYIGVSGQFQLWGKLTIAGSAGVVFDSNGQIAPYISLPLGGLGSGFGSFKGGFGGISIGGFDGSVNDFKGPFFNSSNTYGDEAAVGLQYFAGPSSDGSRLITGGGIEIGTGEGVTSFRGATYTTEPFGSTSISNVLNIADAALLVGGF